MIFEHLIDEMPWLSPHPEFSGQLLMGRKDAHYNFNLKKERIFFRVKVALLPIEPIHLWEIQAEERDYAHHN
jgi:hypothetical protein